MTAPSRGSSLLPRLLLLGAVTLWGWTFVATRILVAELAPLEILALRLAIGLPCLALLLVRTRAPVHFAANDVRPLALGALVFTLHFLIQISGLVTTSATNTGWLIAVSPLALALLSWLFLKERIGLAGVAGILVATGGIVLLVSRGALADLNWLRSTGDWLVLGSASTWAIFSVLTRDIARRRNPLAVTFVILLLSTGLVALPFLATADWHRIGTLSPRGLFALLYLAIPGLALAQWFWLEGVAALGASRAGLYLYLEPLATLTLAVPLLGESLHIMVFVGGGLVLAGVFLGQRFGPTRREQVTDSIQLVDNLPADSRRRDSPT